MSVAALLFAGQPLSSQAAVYEVNATGKNAAAAEGNSRMNALRQCLNEIITPELAKKHAMELRPLFRKVNNLTSIEVLESGKQKKLVAVRASVTVDEDAVRAELKGIPALAGSIKEPAAANVGGDQPAGGDPAVANAEGQEAKPETAEKPGGNGQEGEIQTSGGTDTPEANIAGEPTNGSGDNGGSAEPAASPDKPEPFGGVQAANTDENIRKTDNTSSENGSSNAVGDADSAADADFITLVSNGGADPQSVIKALKAGANPNAAVSGDAKVPHAKEGWPALMVYLDGRCGPKFRDKKVEVVKAFIEAGADVNWADDGFDRSIAENAMYAGRTGAEGQDIFKAVLAAKPDLNRMDAMGHPILHAWLGSESGRSVEMLNLMLAAGADPNLVQNDRGGMGPRKTPVLFDAIKGSGDEPLPAEFLQAMLKAGGNPNISNARGETALHYAVSSKAADSARLLLESGANPNAADTDGYTPLVCAIRADDAGLIRLLAEKGADLNAKIPQGSGEMLTVKELAEKMSSAWSLSDETKACLDELIK